VLALAAIRRVHRWLAAHLAGGGAQAQDARHRGFTQHIEGSSCSSGVVGLTAWALVTVSSTCGSRSRLRVPLFAALGNSSTIT
jgi:hypothetical protein